MESSELQARFPNVNELIDFGKLPMLCHGVLPCVDRGNFSVALCPLTAAGLLSNDRSTQLHAQIFQWQKLS